jgi:c-di-GMP-binding flagellar brake protein YcgR
MKARTKSKGQSPVSSSPRPATRARRQNTRRYQRVEVSLPVAVSTPRKDIRGRIINISLGGAFLLLPELPDFTRPAALIIELPEKQVIVVTARVVRFDMRPVGNGPYHQFGVAVRFETISPGDRLLISKTLLR